MAYFYVYILLKYLKKTVTMNFDNSNEISSEKLEDTKNETKKRTRTNMGNYHRKVLYECFAKDQFPSTEYREELSRLLGLTPRTIQIWFQNQRQKSKIRKPDDRDFEYISPQIRYRKLDLLAECAYDFFLNRHHEKHKN